MKVLFSILILQALALFASAAPAPGAILLKNLGHLRHAAAAAPAENNVKSSFSFADVVQRHEEATKFIVVFKTGSSRAAQEEHLRWLLERFQRHSSFNPYVSSWIDFNSWQAYGLFGPPELAEEVRGQSEVVDWVQENGVFRISASQPNAPQNLKRISSVSLPPSNAAYLFPVSGGANVDVYIIDTGVKADHPLFGDRVKTGSNFVADGVSGDGNGHGTHVAGILGSTIFGVAKNVNIIPVRVLDSDGAGTTEDLLSGLSFATSSAVSSSNPSIINMSLDGPPDSAVDQAVSTLIRNGATVVAAAGNDAIDACEKSPGRVPEVITVGAIDSSNDQLASFSNTGSCIDINAPGVSITSTWIGSQTGGVGPDFDTNVLDGTSMACPHVTGVVAMLLSKNPGLSPAQVATALVGGASTGVISVSGGTTDRNLFNGGEIGL